MIRVFRRHLYHSKPEERYCARGSRDFFTKHGLNWSDFLRNGIPAEAFLKTGDSMAIRAVRHAEQEINGGQ